MSTFTKLPSVKCGIFVLRTYKDNNDALWLNSTDVSRMLNGEHTSLWHTSTAVFDIPEDQNDFGLFGVISACDLLAEQKNYHNQRAFSMIAIINKEKLKLESRLESLVSCQHDGTSADTISSAINASSRTIDSISQDEIQKYVDDNVDSATMSHDIATEILNNFINKTKSMAP